MGRGPDSGSIDHNEESNRFKVAKRNTGRLRFWQELFVEQQHQIDDLATRGGVGTRRTQQLRVYSC